MSLTVRGYVSPHTTLSHSRVLVEINLELCPWCPSIRAQVWSCVLKLFCYFHSKSLVQNYWSLLWTLREGKHCPLMEDDKGNVKMKTFILAFLYPQPLLMYVGVFGQSFSLLLKEVFINHLNRHDYLMPPYAELLQLLHNRKSFNFSDQWCLHHWSLIFITT